MSIESRPSNDTVVGAGMDATMPTSAAAADGTEDELEVRTSFALLSWATVEETAVAESGP